MLTPRDPFPLLWRNSNTATIRTAPHSQGELNPNHDNIDEEERDGESEEGEMADEGSPCWPELYRTGIVGGEAAPSARHFDAGIS